MAGRMVGRLAAPDEGPGGVTLAQDPPLRASLLSRAGMLLGTSLDTGRTLAAIAELLVPSFADHCVVDLLNEVGALERTVTVRMDHARARRTSSPGDDDRRISYPSEHPCAVALATGRPAVAHAEQLAAIRPVIPKPGGRAHPLLTDAATMIAVPLLGPRGIKGVLAVAVDNQDRRFGDSDVELVEEVAARAGFALENAALYERMRSLALTLQRQLLPSYLPVVDGVDVRVGYNPGDESDVGGDLYDVVELTSGRIGIAIGDVQGRGTHAAAVMGQLRAALRAYAVLDLEPGQMMTYLDELVRGLNEALLVTCIYAVYDPFTRECVLSNAGHPPPLLAGPHGCHPMEVPPDVPLGVGGVAFNDHSFVVAPGDTIVLYTDGVVERRDRSVDEGVRALCDALEALGGQASPGALCRATLRVADGPTDDDRAVLAMRTGIGPLPLWRISLPASPQSAASARGHARAVLRQWGIEGLAETVELLVSELVTNAVRHASGPGPTPRFPVDGGDLPEDLDALERTLLGEADLDGLLENAMLDGAVPLRHTDRRIEVAIRRGVTALWVEVHDQDMRLPRVRTATSSDEGGRGLFLVEQLSRRWGTRTTPTGKAVWFQLNYA
jgi:Stage II sporulation protein E (SpoIIE)/GAF domain/Histidine kinase-like ATPase domain